MTNTSPFKVGNKCLVTFVTVASIGFFSPKSFGFPVECVNCSTVYQQALQYAKEVETAATSAQQLQTQIQQYQNMLLQGSPLGNSLFTQIGTDLNKIQNLYNQSTAIAGQMRNFDARFKSRYGDYSSYMRNVGNDPSYVQRFYQEWATNGLDSSRVAMRVAGDNVSQISGEDSRLNDLIGQSQAAQGRLEAIQVGNQIAAQQVQQMQRLREMVNAQIQSQGTYLAQMAQRQAIDDATEEEFYRAKPVRSAAKSY